MTSLVAALGELTRPNVLELSRRLGIARNTVQARIDRLQDSGVIAGWGPVVDLKAMGYDVLAFMTLEIAQGQESAALAELAAIPEVLEIHKTTGPGDLICRVVARTNEHLHVVIEKVLAAPGVQRTTSSLALNSPKLRVHPDAAAVDQLSTASERLLGGMGRDATLDASPAAAALARDRRRCVRLGAAGRDVVDQQRRGGHGVGATARTGGTVVVDTCATHERTRRFLDALAAATAARADHHRRQHPPTRRPHLRQQPAATRDGDHRPSGDARRPARRHDHRRLPTGVDTGARLGTGDEARAIDHRRTTASRSTPGSPDRGAPSRATPPTPPATSSPGSPKNACCSPATSSSTG